MVTMGGDFGAGVAAGSPAAELMGAFTFAYVQAGRIVQHSNATTVLVGGGAAEGDGPERNVLKQAKILRPTSEAQFFHMLSVWQMICHATGLANALASGAFMLQVVHEQIANFGLTWQQAHELFLVYLEAVELAPEARDLNLSNVYNSGGQDMYRERALSRAASFFVKSRPNNFDKTSEGNQGIFRGSDTPSSSKCCLSFNLGKSHPASSLLPNGTCKFAHKCDQWVSQQADGTKGGTCGSTKHGRSKCDNPFKAAAKVE